MRHKKPGEFRVVNQSRPRADGVEKVTGKAIFASDMYLDGMVYAKVLRSPLAHANIKSVNVAEALDRPGVITVISGKDLQGIDPYYGHAVKDQPILALDKVRFVGEPVAVVVAWDELAAHQALEYIAVEYEDIPPVLDVDQALAKGAPLIHEKTYQEGPFRGFEESHAASGSNVCQEIHVAWGDAEKALAAADYVVEGEFYFPMAFAYAMEPYVSVAHFTSGGLTVYSSAQHPYMVRNDLARVFGLPLNRVRMVVPYVGGGYGSKSYTKIEPLTAVCAWKSGRPVKLQLSVEEAFLTTRGDDARVRIRTGVGRDGRLVARQATIHLNTGAYAENSPLVCRKAANRVIGPYRIPNVKVDCYAVYTNTVPASSYRGFGAAQVTLGAETQIDELAEKVAQDPVEFRLANLAARGESIHPGLRPLDADLRSDLRVLAKALKMNEPSLPGCGKAVGCSASDAGSHPASSAIVQVYGDGSVCILTGSSEIGQGSHTVLAQIAAEELGVECDRVRLVGPDTAITPFERSTGASRTTTLMGRAVLEASREAVSQLKGMAAEVLNAPSENLVQEKDGVRYKDRRLSWSEILAKYFRHSDYGVIGRAYLRQVGDLELLPVFWEIGCSGVEVSVDEETGVIDLKHLATVGDVGLAINPAAAEAQDLGAATMGYGIGLFEELLYEGQQLQNGSMLDYRVPRFSDLPEEIDLILAQNQDGVGPYGAKGGGEGSLNPLPASLVNALYRATGVRVRRLPLTPERVWRALKDKQKARKA